MEAEPLRGDWVRYVDGPMADRAQWIERPDVHGKVLYVALGANPAHGVNYVPVMVDGVPSRNDQGALLYELA